MRQVVLAAASVLLLFAAAMWLLAVRERRFPPKGAAAESIYLTSGHAIRRLSIGYSALAADLYWIRTIQYYGGARLRLSSERPDDHRRADSDLGFPLLYPLLDVTTTLDPQFNIAYRFGAIFLAEAYPGGAGRPELAIALLEKGLRERPGKWEYMQDIGFVHYWWRHDYRQAAGWFDRASRLPGAPWWLRSLAAVTLAEGGDRQSSRIMWEAIRQSAEMEWLRRDAERRLMQLRALDQIDDLQPKVDRVSRDAGHPPDDWGPLVRGGVVPGLPLDPSRTPYEMVGGRVRLSPRSPLFPPPDEPKRLVAPIS